MGSPEKAEEKKQPRQKALRGNHFVFKLKVIYCGLVDSCRAGSMPLDTKVQKQVLPKPNWGPDWELRCEALGEEGVQQQEEVQGQEVRWRLRSFLLHGRAGQRVFKSMESARSFQPESDRGASATEVLLVRGAENEPPGGQPLVLWADLFHG